MLLFFTNPLIPELILRVWETAQVERLVGDYDIAVVLTGITQTDIKKEGQIEFLEGADRITEALKLYKKGKVKKILISGGSGSILYPELNEGTALAQFAIDMGVPEEDILLESQSRNTHENAHFTKELIDQNHLGERSILLITSAFHMPRARRCFYKVGITPVCYPVDYRSGGKISYTLMIPSAGTLSSWDLLISEVVGICVYKVMGYI